MDRSVEIGEDADAVRLARAINPFDLLFAHAVGGHSAGKMTNQHEFLAGEIVEPDGDAA